jgi:hypothetical protein
MQMDGTEAAAVLARARQGDSDASVSWWNATAEVSFGWRFV